MSKTQPNISALQWFFRKPSASNFPQDASSPALRQLSSSTEKFSSALLKMGQLSPELAQHSLGFSQWVGKIDSSKDIQKEDIGSLVCEVEEVIQLVIAADPNDIPSEIIDNLNSIVVALAILAKATQDLEFSKEVVLLAESLPQTQPRKELAS